MVSNVLSAFWAVIELRTHFGATKRTKFPLILPGIVFFVVISIPLIRFVISIAEEINGTHHRHANEPNAEKEKECGY